EGRAAGETITLSLDGTVRATATDSTFASGVPGIVIQNGSATSLHPRRQLPGHRAVGEGSLPGILYDAGALPLQMADDADVDTTIKLAIYRAVAETGRVPDSARVAAASGFSEAEVRSSFARLHARRLLVPEPGDPTRIRIAPPFSGIPTAFPVDAIEK